MKYCMQCKLKYNDKYKFCKKCGSKLTVFQNSARNNNVNSNSKNSLILIFCIVIIAVVCATFYYYNNKVQTLENEVKTQEIITKPVDNTISKNVKEEVEKEARAAVDNVRQQNQVINNKNDSVFYHLNQKLKDILLEQMYLCVLVQENNIKLKVSF